ncbi:hypothetical protein O7635_03025 [Asanoa sp. WMMD1127]|uniref:hypothetical protein n=1 Tax=Asanoa sp. WMMD1127 TaxID=3016107 RepID=UPI0024163427|nr:hypothetical protein [Asanoa sp. WMMD1127]MDG4820825.1 hypothetical protein [Asanoa sp. WMMD1127]
MSESWKPWLIRRASPAEPPRQVSHDLVEVAGAVVYVILWETRHGPVLYHSKLSDQPLVRDTDLVRALCTRLLAEERRPDAVLIAPVPLFLDTLAAESDAGPYVVLYPARFADGHRRSGRRHLAGRIGQALGADLPIWVSGTNTLATARRALDHPGRTVQVPDDTIGHKLRQAVEVGLPEAYPLAWAALAAQHATDLDKIRAGLARIPDRGRGWYLAARPRPPELPSPLREMLAAAAPPTDRGEAAAREVIGLQAAADDLDRDDPRIEIYTSAAERLSHLMFQDVTAEIIARGPRSSHLDRARAARPIPATATWAGPVVATWLTTLTPVPDLTPVLRLHRIAKLLKYTRTGEDPTGPPWRSARPGEVVEAYRDGTGRYVLVLRDGPDGIPWMCAEWHRDPTVAATWTDETVLAADRPSGPLLAITPDDTGGVRVDPFPAALTDGGPLRFEPGDPHVLRLLLPLALDPDDAAFATRRFVLDTITEHPGMTLWPALTAPGDALRLRWDTVRAAASADVSLARRLLAPEAPKLYRYYAILNTETTPLDELWQVVRQSATPEGWEIDEHIGPDGAWTHSNILAEINRANRDDEYRRLSPDEIHDCITIIRARR